MANEKANTHNTVDEVEKRKQVVVQIERLGEKLMIPKGMSYDDAIKVLIERRDYDNETVVVREAFDGFIWDGAHAFGEAMKEMFGWFNGESRRSFFGDTHPELMSVQTGLDTFVQIPWGEFSLPNVKGSVQTGFQIKDGRFVFEAAATVRRAHEEQMQELFTLTRKILKERSIYRGKAVTIRFRDDAGRPLKLPEPRFLDLSKINENELIFSPAVDFAIKTNLFTPIELRNECKQLGIPTKRGILLAGPFGTGKTLASYVAGSKAIANGQTFIYCQRADEFHDAVRFAMQYGPAVLFCEDIDKVLAGQRNVKMDDVLNIVDGIEAKGAELMIVLTTNELEKINQAMLRPGRLDAVIEVAPPDAIAAERLIRMYGRNLIPDSEDITVAAEHCAGKIPAVIREIVERSKLSALRISRSASSLVVTNEALLDAAMTMAMQDKLLNRPIEKDRNDVERFADAFGGWIKDGISEAFKDEDGDADYETANSTIGRLAKAHGQPKSALSTNGKPVAA